MLSTARAPIAANLRHGGVFFIAYIRRLRLCQRCRQRRRMQEETGCLNLHTSLPGGRVTKVDNCESALREEVLSLLAYQASMCGTRRQVGFV